MESKALESLGILPERRSRGWLKGILVVVVLAALACGGVVLFRWAGGILGSGDVEVTTSPASDSLFIREHLAVSKIKSIDCETTEVDGRMVATCRQYWFRLSIDEKWYLKRFAPRVKRYLEEIAPDAETRSVLLDTQKLAYSNDGADTLSRAYGSMRVESGDRYSWFDLQDGTKAEQLSRRRHRNDGRNVLVMDRIANDGAETHGTVFVLTEAQYAKFYDWVEQNVLRTRPRITVVARSAERELIAEDWDTNYLGRSAFNPVEDVVYGNGRYYVVSPWISAREGVRCSFLGVSIRQKDGLSDAISFKWLL